jgi:phage gpG-like protein
VSGPLLSISIDAPGVKQARLALGVFAEELPKLEEMQNTRIHPILTTWMDGRFRHGGAWKGDAAWVGYENEPKYAGFKRAMVASGERGNLPRLRWVHGPASQPIQDHERLALSFTDPSHPEHVWTSTRTGFEFGSSVPYAENHQFGIGTQRWDRQPIPRRPILTNNPRVLRTLILAYQDHADETLAETVTETLDDGKTRTYRASGVRRARARPTRAQIEAALGGGT